MSERDLDELTCKELVELATEYLSHAMAADDRARFEHHLRSCDPCTTYLDQLRTTVALAGGLAGGALTDEAERDLTDLFQRWKQQRTEKK